MVEELISYAPHSAGRKKNKIKIQKKKKSKNTYIQPNPKQIKTKIIALQKTLTLVCIVAAPLYTGLC